MTAITDGSVVIEMLKKGKSPYVIADKFGVSVSAIGYWVKKANAYLPENQQIIFSTKCTKRARAAYVRKGRKPNPRRDEARAMKQSGMTYAEIGTKFGISRQRAQQLVSPTKKRLSELRKATNNKCQLCGKRAKKLEFHHSDYSKEPDKLLCTSCHRGLEYDTREKIVLSRLQEQK